MNIKKQLLAAVMLFTPTALFAVDYVILISVDGLRPDAITRLGKAELPAFYRFREEGAWTDNARTDFDFTRTLPNHSTILTARRVVGPNGHGQLTNGTPPKNATLHNNTGQQAYVTSVFDVVHDHGLSTGVYVSKEKFILFDQSYDQDSGSEDMIGENNGTDKIDEYVQLANNKQAEPLIARFVEVMDNQPYRFSFVHITDPDGAGHRDNWTTPNYLKAVKNVDSYLTEIFELIDSKASLAGNTAVILTADHGGTGENHGDIADPLNYQIPFYVWAPEMGGGKDLYKLNPHSRQDPGNGRPNYESDGQPIRNGDAANLALDLLGLPAIPDKEATINATQDLAIAQ